MDKQKLAQYGQLILKRLDLAVIVVLIVLLVAQIYVVIIKEGGFGLTEPPPPSDVPLEDRVATSPEYARIVSKYPESVAPIAEDPNLRLLVQNDMFSLRAVREMEDVRRRMNETVDQAQRDFDAGRVAEARAAVQQVLRDDPTNRRAQDLLRLIDPPATPTPAATPAAGADSAAFDEE
ncbi:MAG: hypothetical protein SF028_07225 [Candidatus Sumerlaeia bacterium]|nr:hypothetical protein [Candidatus Sumerlaeia bacterium]